MDIAIGIVWLEALFFLQKSVFRPAAVAVAAPATDAPPAAEAQGGIRHKAFARKFSACGGNALEAFSGIASVLRGLSLFLHILARKWRSHAEYL
jgi:hypothetical protein